MLTVTGDASWPSTINYRSLPVFKRTIIFFKHIVRFFSIYSLAIKSLAIKSLAINAKTIVFAFSKNSSHQVFAIFPEFHSVAHPSPAQKSLRDFLRCR